MDLRCFKRYSWYYYLWFFPLRMSGFGGGGVNKLSTTRPFSQKWESHQCKFFKALRCIHLNTVLTPHKYC